MGLGPIIFTIDGEKGEHTFLGKVEVERGSMNGEWHVKFDKMMEFSTIIFSGADQMGNQVRLWAIFKEIGNRIIEVTVSRRNANCGWKGISIDGRCEIETDYFPATSST